MNYFKFAFEKTKQNSPIIFFYIIISICLNYILNYFLGSDLKDITKDEVKTLALSYKYYLLIMISTVINSIFSGGMWYSISIEKEISFREYIEKCIYFFSRFLIFGLISFLIVLIMTLGAFIENRTISIMYMVVFSLSVFYIGIKIVLAPAYVVYLDIGVVEAVKRSYFSLKGIYFMLILAFAIIRYFLAKNVILAIFMDVLMIMFYCYIFVKINSLEEERNKQSIIV